MNMKKSDHIIIIDTKKWISKKEYQNKHKLSSISGVINHITRGKAKTLYIKKLDLELIENV